MYHFTIIGGGAACVPLLQQLTMLIEEKKIASTVINIIEKNTNAPLGAGLAYSTKSSEQILRLPVTKMSAHPDKPNHFADWIKANQNKWERDFPDLDIDTDLYPPRYIFGLYLQDVITELCQQAETIGITVNIIFKEAVDIQKMNSGFNITLKDRNDQINELTTNQVFLCTGHMPAASTYLELNEKTGYFNSPWNTVINSIPIDDPIIILGTRLTAIDTVLSLVAHGHRGKIYMASRSGLLPCVIGNSVEYEKKYLTTEAIDRQTGFGTSKLSLDTVLALFWQEIENSEKRKISDEERRALIKPQFSPDAWLKNEIRNSQSTRPWQSVLVSLYPIVQKIWDALKKEDKQKFLDDYYSIWMTYLAAFPISNAKKILALMKSQQLVVLNGLQSVEHDGQQFRITCNDQAYITPYVINCTGAGHDYRHSDSLLIQNLIKNKLVTPYALGGLKVDFKTLVAKNANHELIDGLYIIGDNARGKLMAIADFANQLRFTAIRGANTSISHILKKNTSPRSSCSFFKENGNKENAQLTEKNVCSQGKKIS